MQQNNTHVGKDGNTLLYFKQDYLLNNAIKNINLNLIPICDN